MTVNPAAKLIAAALLAVCLVLTLDPVSAGTAIVLELLLLPLLRIPPRTFWLRTVPIWIAAPLTGLTIALYGQPSGHVWFQWFLIRVTDGSLELALATVLRVIAIALPAVALFITVDPTDLADGLAQTLHLPARFVLGALAGTRLIGLAVADWRTVALARRARGVSDRNPFSRLFGTGFALLVLSIRRGSTLATAMEGRGFGAPIRRTWARPARWGAREWVMAGIGLGIGVASLAAAALAGTWRLIFSG